MASSQQTPLLQVKASVRGPRPPIWRRLVVPANTPLSKIHRIIQAIMGWDSIKYDYHMHEFVSKKHKKRYGSPEYPEYRNADEASVTIGDMLTDEKSSLMYHYDFGCDWEVDIVLEKSLPPDPTQTSPICLTGKRAGPPEDMVDRKGYDPAAFDLNAINEAIQKVCR